MFMVTGTLASGVDYRLTWDDGHLTGTQEALDAVTDRLGQSLLASPTGPLTLIALADPASVLVACYDAGEVGEASGDVPDMVPPVDPDVVY